MIFSIIETLRGDGNFGFFKQKNVKILTKGKKEEIKKERILYHLVLFLRLRLRFCA